MKKILLFMFAFMATITAFGQPTTVPATAGDDQLLLYSNGNQNGFWFDAWGGGTGSTETIDGKEVYKISGFNYFGSQIYNPLDVSNKKYFHVDVYPLQDMTLTFVMINKNEAGTGNDGEKGVQKSLTGNEWNSIDIEVQEYLDKGAAMSRLFQIKFVSTVASQGEGIAGSDGFGNGNGTESFYFGNLYFYGTRVTDTENPVLVTAEASEVGGNSVKLKLNATDNNDKVTFLINDAANNKSYETTGTSGTDVIYQISQLNANTAYSFTVQARDIAGNLSETKTVEFTTLDGFSLTAAPTPDKDAANVISIYSDAYTAATTFNFGSWGQLTAVATETVDGNNMLKLTNYNYLGFEYQTDLDLSEMEYIHIDILPLQTMNFGITPIMRGGKTEDSQSVGTLNVEQWNSIDIPLSQFGFDLTYKTFQLKIDRGTGSETVYVDNIYFWKETVEAPTALTVSAASSDIFVGKTTQLTVTDQNGKTVAASLLDFTTSEEVIATVDESGLVTGVAEGTATITATLKTDATVTNSINITVSVVVGQILTADGHSILLQPYHYTGTENYELIITSEETMTGLGGSFWNINGVGGTRVDANMTVSADGKTLTITATSNQAPQLYTPLYVMMPGEVNFGQPTLEWIEKGGSTVEITAITLSAEATEVEVGKTLQLTATDQDNNAVAASQLTFISGDESKATVSDAGVVTGVAEGEVVITATLKDNTEISNTFSITVTAAAADALTAGEADANGLVKLTGTWDAVQFATIDAAKQANSYDLTEVQHDGTIDVIGKTANPYCIFVTAVAGTVNRNEAVKDGDAYNGFAFFLQEEPNANKPFDINTAISPISVTNPFFQRLFDRAGYYVTMCVPFDYSQIPDAANGTKFYELNASANGGTVTLNFTEVTSIEANKPYLVYSGTGGITIPDPGSVTIDWDAQAESSEVASFVGNYKALQPAESENIYVVPGGVTEQENVSFLKSAGASIRPFRAYLTLTNATKINVVFGDGEATGIRDVSDDMLNALFNIYSIDGKLVKSAGEKMFNLKEGLYIINGKRVIIR